ncbi:neutral/alkaline non-lysosomal ceramidase N-terminal domain-containing protein [Corynebacterium freneyi]|uniref:neutral/alkaline non-lysosomal ceramidase N-terminal domain-containing protein n=1 Tax=Corynebacterium freneyi TaxID=134034 RepID=UPI00254DBDBC|nr:neutral/alkaline non-lysosomal ceramidase N-terminal domain-containing protein [Corynebacterium freneyi]MDK8767070.1 neutral/alkaline non-lysosomal ceramidase N-terminal domain-containing protein [Corynebacterium freneyi]
MTDAARIIPTLPRRAFLGATAATTALGAALATDWGGLAPAAAQAAGDAATPGASSSIPMTVGRGMADMTGEPLGAGMNGYAVLSQQTSGLRQRQFARAFVFDDGNGGRVAHVTADMGLMFQSIQMEVLRRLRARFGDVYHEGNVLIGASHTHVAPGGTSGHLMVDLTTLGFRPVTFEATVAGIVKAIERADADMAPSHIALTRGTVADAGVNRSKTAFDNNPDADKAAFPDGVDRDSVTLHVLRDGKAIGLINWYGIHPTTFGPEHTIVSGDNKGYAAWLAEHRAGVDHTNPAAAPYVAAFAMSTPGDISPNHGLVPNSGPGNGNEYESARILGRRQLDGVAGSAVPLAGGGIDARHQWVDMRDVKVDGRFTPDGQPGTTGPAILGAAFAASSQEDGGGEPMLGFNEGARGGTPWVRQVNQVAVPASASAIHGAKENLLPVGYIPGLVQQTHVFHLHRIGGITIASLAFEPTTVAGLRMRRAIAEALDVDIDTVIVQGYTSGYGHYITTPEEYDQQDYEGGATIFGRLTLPAATQVFDGLASAMAAGIPVDSGAAEGDLTGKIPPSPAGNPFVDAAPIGKNFGDVLTGPDGPVTVGAHVAVAFVGANPNSDLRHESGFLSVVKPGGDNGEATRIADDSHEATVIEFANDGASTTTTITWDTTNVEPGEYVIHYRGSSRGAGGELTPFEGSANVTVVQP